MRNPITLLRRGIVLSLGLALLAAPLGGCHDAPLPVAPTNFPSSGVSGASSLATLDIQAGANSVAAGQTLPLSVVASDGQGNPLDVTAQWTSSNASIATVDPTSGLVTGMHPGTVTITASASAQQATLTLTVLAPGQTSTVDPTQFGPGNGTGLDGTSGGTTTPSGLTIYPAQPGVLVGGQLQMAAFLPGVRQPAAASWKSSDPTVATVDATGMVTAVKAGLVTITASAGADGLTAQTQLLVSSPVASSQIEGIRITPSHVSMNVGDTFWLQAQVPTWSGGYDPNVQWEVGDPTIVNVSVTGQITALAPGSTTVTAIAVSYAGAQPLTATIPVIVNNVATSQ